MRSIAPRPQSRVYLCHPDAVTTSAPVACMVESEIQAIGYLYFDYQPTPGTIFELAGESWALAHAFDGPSSSGRVAIPCGEGT